MSINVFVSIPETGESTSGFQLRKFCISVERSKTVQAMKRQIESEFQELFPYEKQFICAKIEDMRGYSLSNASLIEDLLRHGDKVFAVPETNFTQFSTTSSTEDLIATLENIQTGVVEKLCSTNIHNYNQIDKLLSLLLPLAISNNTSIAQKASLLLSRLITERNIDVLRDERLLWYIAFIIDYWIDYMAENDVQIRKNLLWVVEVLCELPNFVSLINQRNIVEKFAKVFDEEELFTRNKVIQITAQLQRGQKSFAPKKTEASPLKPKAKPVEPLQQRTEPTGVLFDYVAMIQSGDREAVTHAINTIEPILPDAMINILDNPEMTVNCFALAEFIAPELLLQSCYRILTSMADNMTKGASTILLKNNGIMRLLKAYASQCSYIKTPILKLLEAILESGKSVLEIPALVSISLSPFMNINELAMRTISELANPSKITGKLALQFSNHIRFILDAIVASRSSQDYKNNAASCISSLSLQDSLRTKILQQDGVNAYIMMMKDKGNLEGQRLAAKTLVSLTKGHNDLRQRVVSVLDEEIKSLYKQELDGIVASYLQNLAHPS